MTTVMQENFGYDAFGNCERLLAEVDRIEIETGGVRRASGDVVCKCGSKYYAHPWVQGALHVVRTCEGLVHL